MDSDDKKLPKEETDIDDLDREDLEEERVKVRSLEDIDQTLASKKDEDEIDELDDIDQEEEEEVLRHPIDKTPPQPEPVTQRDFTTNLRSSSQETPEAVEQNLDDLAQEEVEEETYPKNQNSQFRTTNIEFDDRSVSERGRDYLPDEESQEIHIPNLRSPKFNQDPQQQRSSVLDSTEYYPQNRGGYNESGYDREHPFRGAPKRRGGASKLHLLILLFIGLAVIGGTVYFLKTQFKSEPAKVVETPAPTSTPSPTPTPEPEAKREDFKVKVLNGTTTTGLASEVTEKLKELGYQTEKGANAPRQNYEQTLVSVKPGQEVLLKTLIKDLSYKFEASAGAELKESDPLDAQIILGKK